MDFTTIRILSFAVVAIILILLIVLIVYVVKNIIYKNKHSHVSLPSLKKDDDNNEENEDDNEDKFGDIDINDDSLGINVNQINSLAEREEKEGQDENRATFNPFSKKK